MTSTMRDVAELDERMRLFRIETDTSDATSNADSDNGEELSHRSEFVKLRENVKKFNDDTSPMFNNAATQSMTFTYAKGTNLTKGQGADFNLWAQARVYKDQEIANAEQDRNKLELIASARQLTKRNKNNYGANYYDDDNNQNTATTTGNWPTSESAFCSKWVSEGMTSNEIVSDMPSRLKAFNHQIPVENIKFYNNTYITFVYLMIGSYSLLF